MIYVYPNRPRSWLWARVMWMPVLIQTWLLAANMEGRQRLSYARHWADRSLRDERNLPGDTPAKV